MHSFPWVIRIAAVLSICLGGAAAEATDYRFVPGGADNYWMTSTNGDPEGVPNSVNDVAIFDASGLSAYSTNVHNLYFVIREMRFATGSTWRIHNDRQDPTLRAPEGEIALITQNGAGAVTFDTDLVFNSNTVFGGTGTGNITVNSSGNALYKETLRGPGGLTINGNYTLTLNLPASYQGPTTINAGAVLFNGDTPAPVYDGITVVGYTPVTLQPVTVNSSGTLGGRGTLRAPVMVNAGGHFAPSAGGPGVFTIDGDLTLAAGSTTLIELGGTSPGNGSGYHDQVIVTGQLSLGGTLDVSLHGSHVPTKGDSYTILQYDSLDPNANTFDALSFLPLPGRPANYQFVADYGSGTNGAVTLNVNALPHYYTRGHAEYDWWGQADNWSHGIIPGENPNEGDVVIFALTVQPSYSVNTHSGNPYTVKEMRIEGTSNWRFYNPVRDIGLRNLEAGGNALFTHDGSGTVTLDCDLVMNSDTIFGGTGSGTIAINGSPFHSTLGPALGLTGSGGLTKNGNYTVAVNTVANYQGETVINAGRLLFNGQSAMVNPGWVAGEPDTYYNPVTMAPVTVNDGGTLGGTGTLRAPVTVHSGGSLAPGVSPGVFTIDHDLTLAAGSSTLIELGGLAPGNGSGYHDQVIVTGQLSLGGTLAVSLHGSHVPTKGDSYTVFQYGSLDPNANAFDTISSPASGIRANYRFVADYGSGTNDAVRLSVIALPHYYTRGHATDDWWHHPENWSHALVPGANANEGDVVVFALTGQSSYSVNTHSGNPYTVKEIKFEGTSNWRFYNAHRDIGLRNPELGGNALFTHDGSGTVTLDCDLVMISDTIFGGTGSGTISINGSPFHSTLGPAVGVTGSGGLTKNGDFALVVNTVANYQGETVINAGMLLFNGQSAMVNPDWVAGEPDTYYNPVTMAQVIVNDGGTLGGRGILRAPVTVHSGGILSPGASAGIFTVDTLTLEPGAVTLMELGGLVAGNGDGFHDQVVVAGLLSLGGTLELSLLGDFEPTVGDQFVLFQYGSLDPTHNAFDSLSIPFAGEFVLNYGTGVNSQVILRAVPEPGALTLLLLGIGVLLAYRRRG